VLVALRAARSGMTLAGASENSWAVPLGVVRAVLLAHQMAAEWAGLLAVSSAERTAFH
jgi:hypothetical protein